MAGEKCSYALSGTGCAIVKMKLKLPIPGSNISPISSMSSPLARSMSDNTKFASLPNLELFHSLATQNQSLLTRIRVGRSLLNQHSFTIGLSDSPECACHFRSESSEHYFLDCFLYTPERQTLLSLVEHYVPNFTRLTKKNKLDLLLRGVNLDNDEFLPTNTILTKAVQNFILQTKRFVKIEIEE